MAKLGFNAARHAPKASADAIPAHYSKLGSERRRAVRNRYVELQEGKCHYCERDLDGPPSPEVRAMHVREALFPTGFFDNPVHLHHDHKTDLTIGAVHARCNAVLWQYHGE